MKWNSLVVKENMKLTATRALFSLTAQHLLSIILVII